MCAKTHHKNCNLHFLLCLWGKITVIWLQTSLFQLQTFFYMQPYTEVQKVGIEMNGIS